MFFHTFFSNEDFANELILSANVTMAIAEQVIEKMMQTLNGIEKISNDSLVVDLSLSLILPEHPWTVEYALIGSAYSLAVMKSWTRSINSRNWTDVSITFRFDYMYYTAHSREIVPRGGPPLLCCVLMNSRGRPSFLCCMLIKSRIGLPL